MFFPLAQEKEGKSPLYVTQLELNELLQIFQGVEYQLMDPFQWPQLPAKGKLTFQTDDKGNFRIVSNRGNQHLIAFMWAATEHPLVLRFKVRDEQGLYCVIPHQERKYSERMERLRDLSLTRKIRAIDFGSCAILQINGIPFWCEKEVLGKSVTNFGCGHWRANYLATMKVPSLRALQDEVYKRSQRTYTLVHLKGIEMENDRILLTHVDWSDLIPGWSEMTLLNAYAFHKKKIVGPESGPVP